MSNTLTLLDRTPDWIEALCREIDTLKFASAFDTFTPDAILAFGVKQITGASAMQAFFVKIDSPLNIDHRILEVWDGDMTTFVRGEAEMAKKAEPNTTLSSNYTSAIRSAGQDGGWRAHTNDELSLRPEYRPWKRRHRQGRYGRRAWHRVYAERTGKDFRLLK
jgi:hypothetical protein